MPDRRQFLELCASVGVSATLMPRLARAEDGSDKRFVLVILRGAMDGLSAVAPWADPRYVDWRQELAVGSPGSDGGALDLDGYFGLHPSLETMHGLYRRGELTVLHAFATGYRERSHFDGQKQLENGANGPLARDDGWLNRALTGADRQAIAITPSVPLVLLGSNSVNSWSPNPLNDASEDTLARIARLYAGDEFLGGQFRQALETRAMVDTMQMEDDGRAAFKRGQAHLQTLVSACANFLLDPRGPRIAVLEMSGWDTHANQANRLKPALGLLDGGIAQLRRELGSAWQDTVVAVVSEFGRTVEVNGSKGTDHGTGNAAFVMGGGLRGGKVVADWPGLAARNLYQGRDLRPTQDLRALFKTILGEHLGISTGRLEREIFPGSGEIKPLPDLFA